MTDDLFADLASMASRFRQEEAKVDVDPLGALGAMEQNGPSQDVDFKSFGRFGRFGRDFEEGVSKTDPSTASGRKIPPHPQVKTGGRVEYPYKDAQMAQMAQNLLFQDLRKDGSAQSGAQMAQSAQNPDILVAFDERAAILEFHERLTREEADLLAAEQIGLDRSVAPVQTSAVILPLPVEVSWAEYDAHLDEMIAAAGEGTVEANVLAFRKRKGAVVARGDGWIFTRGRQ